MNLLIVQARMGSSRLPGKVLMKINGITILEHLFKRLKYSRSIDKIVVATTFNFEDNEIELLCKSIGVDCYRGSDWDVLDRFFQTAKKFNPLNIIRVTSDCPLNHFSVVDFSVDQFLSSSLDYFSNSNNEPDYLEDGFDVEVFSFKALETAWQEANLMSEREHVTPYIKNSGKFKCGWKKFSNDYQYKLSVDTQEDFNVVSEIFGKFSKHKDFGMIEILELLKSNPEILSINHSSEINSGYKKSLQFDKKIK
ncbi:MAG: cytidylyltransferase domain-containing protein [Bacteroidota bacterium]|jgi:spore coat polysaccharide biosynthesis protein SpsF